MSIFRRNKGKPVEVSTEPVTNPRIAKAIKEIEEGKELSKSIRAGSSGMVVYYEIKTMQDGAVCNCCKEMHGQKFMFEHAKIGVNYPPFDCCEGGQCRCMALSRLK